MSKYIAIVIKLIAKYRNEPWFKKGRECILSKIYKRFMKKK